MRGAGKQRVSWRRRSPRGIFVGGHSKAGSKRTGRRRPGDRTGVGPGTGPAARRPFWATQAGGETTVEASLLAHQSRNYPISQSCSGDTRCDRDGTKAGGETTV